MAKKPAPDAQAALEDFFAEIFLNIMLGMTKSGTVEAEFSMLKEATQKMTREEMRRIASKAGKFYAERANPPSKLTKEKAAALKVKALQFGMQDSDDENKTQAS